MFVFSGRRRSSAFHKANITKSVQGCNLKTMFESSVGGVLKVEVGEAADFLPVFVGVTRLKVF